MRAVHQRCGGPPDARPERAISAAAGVALLTPNVNVVIEPGVEK
jgi:hypothetical protein